MADVAHHVSGPAPPKPGDIAPQQASRPDSPDRGKLRVFISYSRDDLDFADQLDAALDACGFECVIDRHGISGGEDWKRRLGNLISEADTVVFVLSPTSARSEICAWEVEEAARLGKRILPVNCRQLEGTNPPPRLRDLNYIFFYEDPKAAGFGLRHRPREPGRGSQHRLRLAARAHPLPSARYRVGQGRPASEPAAVRRRYRRGKGLGGATAQECARAHGPAPRLHPRERRGGGGAIERPTQATRRRWRRPRPSARPP